MAEYVPSTQDQSRQPRRHKGNNKNNQPKSPNAVKDREATSGEGGKQPKPGSTPNRATYSELKDRQLKLRSTEEVEGKHVSTIPVLEKTREGGKSNTGGLNAKKKAKSKAKPMCFEQYWKTEDVQHGLKSGTLFQGAVRINPKNYEDAYIPHPNGQCDIYISGMKNRNRALNGDIVAVLPFPKGQWKVLVDDMNSLAEEMLSKAQGAVCSDDVDDIEIGDLSVNTDGSIDIPDSQEPMVDSVAVGSGNDREQELFAAGTKHLGRTAAEEQAVNTAQNKKFTSVADLMSDWSVASSNAQKIFQSKVNDGGLIDESDQLPDSVLQVTCKVVYILERKHSRACTGHIRLLQDGNRNMAQFSPKDNRVPRILVPMSGCPKDFVNRPKDYEKTLFIARITNWPETSKFAHGVLMRSLGEAGQIEPETEGLLMEYDVDYSDFSHEVLACLPQTLPWCIPEKELTSRRDLRNLCIFTIDPATARDLDDALSCVQLENGCYEIGVHIADVSYFIDIDSALDEVAASRATSVYLVQKVVPMLPGLLCEQLCSLNPGEDRLSFSVIWTITDDGLIASQWFGRTIIRSCVKLSYDHAQGFIDDPEKEWTEKELPSISGGYSVDHIKNVVLQLDKIAKNLRKKRYDNGALRLDQIKLQFSLNHETGLPNGYSVYQQKDSNRLIEEYMLLANMAVARKIYEHFPEIAVLRRHPKPQSKMLKDLAILCHELGVPLDVTSSRTIQQSLEAYSGESEENKAKFLILTSLCSRPMQNARYFCTGALEDETLYHHYALNVPFYTHFTSPIRRYPDVMVHRLLAAALGYCATPVMSISEVQKEAEHCNDKKLAAKRVSELSSELFFAVFVKECGPIEEQAMVMTVLDKAFDILILKLGVIKRVYIEKLPVVKHSYSKEGKSPRLELTWAADDNHQTERLQVIKIFTPVNCRLTPDPAPLKWNAVVLHPDDVLAIS